MPVPSYVPPAHVIEEIERIRREKQAAQEVRPSLPLPIVVR